MSRVASAHQPNFLPYLGFFDKMASSDVMVIRDEVQFTERDFHHRNRIRINGNNNEENPQSTWLTLPVEKKQEFLRHIRIKPGMVKNQPWNQYLIRQIESAYRGSGFFSQYYPELQRIFSDPDNLLVSFNMKLISFLRQSFGINTEIVMASSLGLKPDFYTEKTDPSEDLARICQAVGADIYLSGAGGRDYLNLEPFKKRGIEVKYQDFKHPVYTQKFPGFVPNMASIDALFCTGGMKC